MKRARSGQARCTPLLTVMRPSVRRVQLGRPILNTFAVRLIVGILVAAGAAACSSSDLSVTSPTSAKCQVTVDNAPSTVPAAGGTGSLNVTTTRDCTWDASTPVPWVTLMGDKSGQGSGSVNYQVAANVDPSTRRATLTVNDAQVVVAQDAAQCRFTVSQTSASPGADGARIAEIAIRNRGRTGFAGTVHASAHLLGGRAPASAG